MKQGVLVVRIDGEIDMHTASAFRQNIDYALDKSGAKNVLLNLKGVTFIDSSGLGVILGRYKRISLLGGIMMATYIQPQIMRIFELAGLVKIIRIFGTETEALDNF